MKRPQVTIIMPVYKAEATIRKSLDSILAQTLGDWELVIVDDGSPDSSGSVCDEYAQRDSRITVIHQQNGGVSAARQAGLDMAKGEYVIHVDPDDWVEPEMLDELYKKAKSDDADMVICDFISDTLKQSYYKQQKPSSLQPSEVLNDMFSTIHGSCCNKLVKKSCIDRYHVFFPVGINYCEDVCFNLQLLKHDIKVSYLNKAYYHYVQFSSSITNHYTLETLNAHKKYIEFISMYMPDNSLPIISSKEFVKKLAFKSGVLSNSEFDTLYPEIKSVHNGNPFMRIMYGLAFSGHSFLAGGLRYIYNVCYNL